MTHFVEKFSGILWKHPKQIFLDTVSILNSSDGQFNGNTFCCNYEKHGSRGLQIEIKRICSNRRFVQLEQEFAFWQWNLDLEIGLDYTATQRKVNESEKGEIFQTH